MCDEAHTCLTESKEKEDSGERRDEWRELLQQTKSRSEDSVADYTYASFDTAAETADGQWRARLRQSTQFRNVRGFKEAQ